MNKMKKLKELGISPSPWTAENFGYLATWINNNKGKKIAKVGGDAEGLLIEDANIMSAAPELYECLREEFEKVCINDGKCTDCQFVSQCRVKKWRTALAKASGEDNGKQV